MLDFLDKPGVLIVLLLALILFGYKRLPDASRSLGRSMRILKAETKGLRSEDEPTPVAQVTAAPVAQPVLQQPVLQQQPVQPVVSQPAVQQPLQPVVQQPVAPTTSLAKPAVTHDPSAVHQALLPDAPTSRS